MAFHSLALLRTDYVLKELRRIKDLEERAYLFQEMMTIYISSVAGVVINLERADGAERGSIRYTGFSSRTRHWLELI